MGLDINRLELGRIVGFIFKRFSKRICVAKPDPWILALEELLRNWNSQLSNRPTRITIGSKWDHFKFDSVRLYGPGLETKAKSRWAKTRPVLPPTRVLSCPSLPILGLTQLSSAQNRSFQTRHIPNPFLVDFQRNKHYNPPMKFSWHPINTRRK